MSKEVLQNFSASSLFGEQRRRNMRRSHGQMSSSRDLSYCTRQQSLLVTMHHAKSLAHEQKRVFLSFIKLKLIKYIIDSNIYMTITIPNLLSHMHYCQKLKTIKKKTAHHGL